MDTFNEDIERMKSDYAFLRHLLNQAMRVRERINTNFGLDDDEMVGDLKQMIAASKFEQETLLAMLNDGDVVSDPLLAIREARRSNELSTKNDVTISGISDTTLLRMLDGRL